MSQTSLVIKLHDNDDVLITRGAIAAGTTLADFDNLVVAADVPPAHKIACRDVAQGAPVRRYGQIIGFATQAIHRGDHVHVHNMSMG